MSISTDKTYTAWRNLKKAIEKIGKLQEQLAELSSSIEEAKTECTAGIRRAQDIRNKRRVPYHKALILLILSACLTWALPTHSQSVEHQEGQLLDTSTSMGRTVAHQTLFRNCVMAAKRLLGSQPSNTRVWVTTIASDSFGGSREILSGWTPEGHGIFIDDLTRARRQLAERFEAKSASLAPNASGTDIIGGLWRVKTFFESAPNTADTTRAIWIFSDMMNETKEFPMPELLEIGPERMLERAKGDGLVVPLAHYQVHVYGASTGGLTPQGWMTIKRFWELYFATAGAQVVTYSAECNAQRPTE